MLAVVLLSTFSTICQAHSLVRRQDNIDSSSQYAKSPKYDASGLDYPQQDFNSSNGSFLAGFKSGNFSGFENKGGISAFSSFQAPKARSKEVAPGVFSFTSSGFIISLFIVTKDGVMVIDPMKLEHAQAMLEEIRRITQAPIKYLFYSHDHWDHTIGGQVFKDQGATIVSHIDAYDWIKANPTEDLVLPDEIWQGSQTSYTLGDVTIELHHEGLSHGSGMTTFVLQKSKVPCNCKLSNLSSFRFKVGYIADLVSPKAVGYQFLPDFHISGLLNTLEKITEYEVDTIVFAHNGNYLDPLETGNKDTVRFAIQYYKES